MATTMKVQGTFETNVETYWRSIFFEPEYNQRLYGDALGFKSFEILELTGEPGGPRTRKMRTEPAADAPAVVRKLIGDSLTYTETGRWDPETRKWTFEIVTNRLADKVSIKGTLWAEERGEHRCERICEIQISVNVFGVGGAVEKFIEKTTRESYLKANAFTNEFIREKGL